MGIPALRSAWIVVGLTAEYKGSFHGRSLHWFAERTISGSDAWVLTYTAEPDSYGIFLGEARTTIESFQLG